jgi:hypothetical protein
MAGVYFKGATGSQAFSTSTKTMLQIIAASNHRVAKLYFVVSCSGGLVTDVPVLFQVLTQTDAGTGTALTLQKYRSGDGETIQTTSNRTHTVEPAAGNILDGYSIQTFKGSWTFGPYEVAGGARLGIRVLTPAAGANCNISVFGEE